MLNPDPHLLDANRLPCPVPGSMGRVRIVLGIGGGIAAYKAAILLRLLKESGHDVVPLPTDTALRFVGAPTWEALSGHPVNTSVFDEVQAVNHVRQAEEADDPSVVARSLKDHHAVTNRWVT